jgi:hypothetical protein
VSNWDDGLWGSPLLDELERVRVLGEGPAISKDDVLDAIMLKTRDIVNRSSDSHTSELADFVLILATMLKSQSE